MTWNEFWKAVEDFLRGAAAKDQLQRANGGKPLPSLSGTITMGLPTGYNAEAARAAARATLEALCQELVSAPDLVSRDITGDQEPETFCNRAVQRAAERYGCVLFAGLTANMITARLAAGLPGWRRVTGIQASLHALAGGLAIAAKQYPRNGHVAVVAPRPVAWSGSWGRSVPYVANVGRPPNAVKKVSEAFLVASGEPDYFIFGETA